MTSEQGESTPSGQPKASGLRRKSLILLLLLSGCALLITFALAFAGQARLSGVVALIYQGAALEDFLKRPTVSFVEAYFRFMPDLPEDVIFGIDQEFIEGLQEPKFIKGGDWMSFVGLQRTGTIWVATGTDETMKGQASKDRAWKFLTLGQQFKSNTWYRIRCYCDFNKRYFQRLEVEGDGMKKEIPLNQYKLDYPNFMPFDRRALSYYVYAMRSRSMMKSGDGGKPFVYFDDVRGGIEKEGKVTTVFENSFEQQRTVENQPLSGPPIKIDNYQQERFYLERPESRFRIEAAPFAHGGAYVGVADAGL